MIPIEQAHAVTAGLQRIMASHPKSFVALSLRIDQGQPRGRMYSKYRTAGLIVSKGGYQVYPKAYPAASELEQFMKLNNIFSYSMSTNEFKSFTKWWKKAYRLDGLVRKGFSNLFPRVRIKGKEVEFRVCADSKIKTQPSGSHTIIPAFGLHDDFLRGLAISRPITFVNDSLFGRSVLAPVETTSKGLQLIRFDLETFEARYADRRLKSPNPNTRFSSNLPQILKHESVRIHVVD